MDERTDITTIYKFIVKAWRRCGWGWADVAAAHQLDELLSRKLRRWHDDDGYPLITVAEWKSIVATCRAEEERGKTLEADIVDADGLAAPELMATRVGEQGDAAPIPAENPLPTPNVSGESAGAEAFPPDTDASPSQTNVQETTGGAAVSPQEAVSFATALAKASTKVQGVLKALGVKTFEDACSVTENDVLHQDKYGKKTWNSLSQWLTDCKAGTFNGQLEAQTLDESGQWLQLPKAVEAMSDFKQCLSRAPTKVRKLLEEHKVASWKGLLAECKNLEDAPGYGKKTWEAMKVWLERAGTPPEPVKCAEYGTWNKWVNKVCESVMANSGMNFEESWPIFSMRTGLTEEGKAGDKLPTLEDVAKHFSKNGRETLSRERVRQIESFYLGGKGVFQGLSGDLDRFGDFLGIAEEIFGEVGVLDFDEFKQRWRQKSPWPEEECTLRASRLIGILLDPDGEGNVHGFVTFRYTEREKARYEVFVATVQAAAGRNEVAYELLRGTFAPELTQTEYDCFKVKALKESPKDFRDKLGKETRTATVSKAIVEILGAVGKEGMTVDDLQNALHAELQITPPNVRGIIGRPGGFDLGKDENGNTLTIWIANQGGGDQEKKSKYALSSCWPRLGADKVIELEKELVEHLNRNGCTAGVLGIFYEKWCADGRVPKNVCLYTFREMLKRDSGGTLIDYPTCRKAIAYALPGANVPDENLFGYEARIYFKGNDRVEVSEMMRFATEVYGYADKTQAYTACRQTFGKKKGNCFYLPKQDEASGPESNDIGDESSK